MSAGVQIEPVHLEFIYVFDDPFHHKLSEFGIGKNQIAVMIDASLVHLLILRMRNQCLVLVAVIDLAAIDTP